MLTSKRALRRAQLVLFAAAVAGLLALSPWLLATHETLPVTDDAAHVKTAGWFGTGTVSRLPVISDDVILEDDDVRNMVHLRPTDLQRIHGHTPPDAEIKSTTTTTATTTTTTMTTMTSMVTVGIKTFNRPSCAKNLIDSILYQYPGMSIIIVNDGVDPIPLLRHSAHGLDGTELWHVQPTQVLREVGMNETRRVRVRISYTQLQHPLNFTYRDHALFSGFPRLPTIDDEEKGGDSDLVSHIHQIQIPFDSGVSMGRNVLVQSCQTPYILMTDDDYELGPDSNLLLMTRLLELSSPSRSLTRVASNLLELSASDQELVTLLGLPRHPDYPDRLLPVDIVGGIRTEHRFKTATGLVFPRGSHFSVDTIDVSVLAEQDESVGKGRRKLGGLDHFYATQGGKLRRLVIQPSTESVDKILDEYGYDATLDPDPSSLGGSSPGQRLADWLAAVREGNCLPVDFIQQFFMARVDSLRGPVAEHLWDPHLKNNDHYDFFLRASGRIPSSLAPPSSLNILGCSQITYLHAKTTPGSKCMLESKSQSILGPGGERIRYAEFRKRWIGFVPYLFRKWGVGVLSDRELDKRVLIVRDKQRQAGSLAGVDSKKSRSGEGSDGDDEEVCRVVHWRGKFHSEEYAFPCPMLVDK